MSTARDTAGGAPDRGLVIEPVASPADARAAATLLRDIWQAPDGYPVSPEILQVLGHTDNYTAMARLDGEIVAASAAIRTGDHPPQLHSHITGVAAAHRGRSIGLAMKSNQRAWCLHRGIITVTWTFDPLQWRNGAFNIRRLGAAVVAYLPDFYGTMSDAINHGMPSDRAYVSWDLTKPMPDGGGDTTDLPTDRSVPLVTAGEGVPAFLGSVGADVHTIAVPTDIGRLRQEDRDTALAWQLAVRRAFIAALDAGYAIVGFDRKQHYVLTRQGSNADPAR